MLYNTPAGTEGVSKFVNPLKRSNILPQIHTLTMTHLVPFKPCWHAST